MLREEVDSPAQRTFARTVSVLGTFNPGLITESLTDPTKVKFNFNEVAWVGSVTLAGGRAGLAVERFTRHGPAALLPLPGGERWALVWCVPRDDDPVRDLNDAQRAAHHITR